MSAIGLPQYEEKT